jgi:aminoglycoside phosphotransferase (APT) family kinase protein
MAADAPPAPAEFPGYDVVEQLARTELSVVYGGRARAGGAPVVIKTTPPGVDALVSLAFAREARVLADVRSRHTARVIEVGEVAGQPFLVLERVRGPSLETALAAGRPTFVQAVSVLAQLARGLADVHARDLIPRRRQARQRAARAGRRRLRRAAAGGRHARAAHRLRVGDRGRHPHRGADRHAALHGA